MEPHQAYQYIHCRHLRRKREKRTERIPEEIISINVLNLMKNINIQEAQQTPNKMKKSMRPIPRHIIIKLSKSKENSESSKREANCPNYHQ